MVNGTTDSFAVIFDANNGEELWKYKMEADGTAPPLIYEHKGKQYVSFLSTGTELHFGTKNKSSTLYTFSLSEN